MIFNLYYLLNDGLTYFVFCIEIFYLKSEWVQWSWSLSSGGPALTDLTLLLETKKHNILLWCRIWQIQNTYML